MTIATSRRTANSPKPIPNTLLKIAAQLPQARPQEKPVHSLTTSLARSAPTGCAGKTWSSRSVVAGFESLSRGVTGMRHGTWLGCDAWGSFSWRSSPLFLVFLRLAVASNRNRDATCFARRRTSRTPGATDVNPGGFPGLHVLAVLVAICALTVTACNASCKCEGGGPGYFPQPPPSDAGDAASEQ
jgi:hypothetical protein